MRNPFVLLVSAASSLFAPVFVNGGRAVREVPAPPREPVYPRSEPPAFSTHVGCRKHPMRGIAVPSYCNIQRH